MQCVKCGAELRPNARFCNSCGAHQPEPAGARETEAADATDATEAPATSTATVEPAGEGRRKRPPRVPRVLGDDAQAHDHDGDDAQRAADTSGAPVEPADAEAPAAIATDRLPELSHAHNGDSASTPEASPAGESEPADSLDWADAETIESSTVLPPAGPRVTTPTRPVRSGAGGQTGMPALDELAKPASGAREQAGAAGESWEDGLPWPLPPSIIVGGRYRVEALISASPDPAAGENVYTVTDLQGYERCWSCGTRYDASAGTDRFCRECGADMLAREYVMRERQAAPTADAADTAGVMAETAETVETGAIRAADAATDEEEERSFTQGARAYRVAPKASDAPAFPRGVHLVYGAATDVGASRPGEDNEDSLGVLALGLAHESRTRSLLLAVVADGLGGHASGQDASRLVVRTLVEYVAQNLAVPLAGDRGNGGNGEEAGEQARAALVDGARKANVALCQLNADQGVDMGSTLVAALIAGETAYIANAGDSRAYVLDGDELRRITSDHSLVEQLIAGGLIRPEERYTHPQRNQIYRSLGGEPDGPVDIFEQRLAPGMRLLLCSDGLWEMVRDDELARILCETPHLQDACDALIRAANAHGGEDNIAALVVEVRA